MANRYYSQTPITGQKATIDGPEAHHLLHVMRAKVGQQIVLIDDSGYEFETKIIHTSRSEVTLEVLSKQQVDREFPGELTLAVALPKGDRQRWLVEKAVELGVTNLQPIITERSVSQPTEKAISRLHRTAIEATKQCGRTRVMKILPACNWTEVVQHANDQHASDELVKLLAHPGGDKLSTILRQKQISDQSEKKIIIAIGPEGGFTDAEVELAKQNHWQHVALGPRILRVETAMTMLTAMVLLWCDE